MKNLIPIAFMLMLLSSCVEVVFEQPQPIGAKFETTIPESLQGKYLDKDGDTLHVGPTSYILGKEQQPFHLEGKLSDKLGVTKYGNHFFLNSKNDSVWTVLMIMRLPENGLKVMMIDGGDEKAIEKLKNLTLVREVYDHHGEIDAYVINPTPKELDRMVLKGCFSKAETFKRISNQ